MTIELTDDEREKFARYLAEQGGSTRVDTVVSESGDATEDVPMIVAYTRYVDTNGVTQQKQHGPMPVAEWAAYERKNGM